MTSVQHRPTCRGVAARALAGAVAFALAAGSCDRLSPHLHMGPVGEGSDVRAGTLNSAATRLASLLPAGDAVMDSVLVSMGFRRDGAHAWSREDGEGTTTVSADPADSSAVLRIRLFREREINAPVLAALVASAVEVRSGAELGTLRYTMKPVTDVRAAGGPPLTTTDAFTLSLPDGRWLESTRVLSWRRPPPHAD